MTTPADDAKKMADDENKQQVDEQSRKASLYTALMIAHLEEQGIVAEEVLSDYLPVQADWVSEVVMRSVQTKTVLDEDLSTHKTTMEYLDEWLDPATVFERMRTLFEDLLIGREEQVESVRWVRFRIDANKIPARIRFSINEAPKWVQKAQQERQLSRKRSSTKRFSFENACNRYTSQICDWVRFSNKAVECKVFDLPDEKSIHFAHANQLNDSPKTWPPCHALLTQFKRGTQEPIRQLQLHIQPQPQTAKAKLLWNVNEECFDEREVLGIPSAKRARSETPAEPPVVESAACVEVSA